MEYPAIKCVYNLNKNTVYYTSNNPEAGELTASLLPFRLSFFFQGVLRFLLCIWLLLVLFFAHAVLLDKT